MDRLLSADNSIGGWISLADDRLRSNHMPQRTSRYARTTTTAGTAHETTKSIICVCVGLHEAKFLRDLTIDPFRGGCLSKAF